MALALVPAAHGRCKVCREPMAGYKAGENDHCGVYCAVIGLAPIDGLSDGEILQHFVAELLERAKPRLDRLDIAPLQVGVARLLLYLTFADEDPWAEAITPVLQAMLAKAPA